MQKTTYRIEICINQDWYKVHCKNIQTINLAKQKLLKFRYLFPQEQYRLVRTTTRINDDVLKE